MTGAGAQRPLERREWATAGGYAVLVVHAIGRHRWLFGLTWTSVVGLCLGLLAVLPKRYDVQATIQVTPTQVISALSTRSAQLAMPLPSSYAADTVFSHQNLVNLVHQSGLLERWPQTRAPALKLKDGLWKRLFRAPTEAERIESFVGLLENKIWVSTDQTSVTIGVHFPDPQLALRLVEAAEQNFLEGRQVVEISSIGEAIAILERRASEARDAMDASLKNLQELRAGKGGSSALRARRATDAAAVELPIDAESSELVARIQAKERAISDLHDLRRRRIAELSNRLAELKALYSDTHPLVIDLQQNLEALKQESPQVLALQKELAPMQGDLTQRGLLADVPLRANRAREAALRATSRELEALEEGRDPEIDHARSQLQSALRRYNGMLDRIDGARLEQDSAQAAFKYRYVVTQPAQGARHPASPNTFLVILASVIAGFVLASIVPALVDLTSRTFVERWQVENLLGVPILGELRDL